MLDGIRIKDLKKTADERGIFAEIMRGDWKEFFGGDELVQSNFSYNYPGNVRAWHLHEHGQVDYFVVLRGSMKVCAFDEKTKELNEMILSGENLQIARIPGKYWHGVKALGNEPAILIYFVSKLYDYGSPDEKRRPWDDKKTVPQKINGKDSDPRIGKPWDWFAAPYK